MKLFVCFALGLVASASFGEINSIPGCEHASQAPQKNSLTVSDDLETGNVAVDTSFTIDATWIGNPQWMSGHDNGFEAFNGSIARGHNFYKSSLLPSQFVPVEIKLNSDSTKWSKTRVFRRTGYTSTGVGTFPGSAWDISDTTNPRRLNLLMVECYSSCGGTIDLPNFRWDPDTSDLGKHEYLFVMLSNYDSTASMYADSNILLDVMDNLYAWWPRVAPGHTFFETDSASLVITPVIGLSLVPSDTLIDLSWTYPGTDPDHFEIYYSTDSTADILLSEVAGSVRSYTHGGLILDQRYYYRIKSFDADDNEIYFSKVKSAKTRQTSLGLSLFGQWDLRSNYGGIWGYTDSATGLEYALLCCRGSGLSILDINTTPPVEVAFVPQSGNGIGTQEVRTYGHYAVVCMDGIASGIIDLADVSNPQVISTIPGGQHTLQVYKNYAIFAGGNSPVGLEIYDIIDPFNPSFVSSYDPYYYHDYAIRNDTLAGFGIYGDGIDLIDISNIAQPDPIGHFNYTSSGAHNGVFSNDGRYLFVGDEIGQGPWTRVFDVSDPQSVSQVADIIVDPNVVVHNCEIKGDHLYIAHYVLGLRVWNVEDPLLPYEVAFYDTFPQVGGGYNGAWGVYPHFASGKIIVSDMANGLFVFESTLLGNSCCEGVRGDIDDDGDSTADILDVNYLVDDIFRGGYNPPCAAEADLNNDGKPATMFDLHILINKMFRGGPDFIPCP